MGNFLADTAVRVSERFNRDTILRSNLLVDIYNVNVYKKMRNYYVGNYNLDIELEQPDPVDESNQVRDKTNSCPQIGNSTRANPDVRRKSTQTIDGGERRVRSTLPKGFDDFKWNTIPKLPTPADWFMYNSTTYMIFSILRDNLPTEKFIAMFNTQLPARCYLVGRFVFGGGSMGKVTGNLLCFLHLSWRAYQQLKSKTYNLRYVIFMMQDKPNIKQLYKLIDCYNHQDTDLRSVTGLQRLALDSSCYRVEKHNKIYYRVRPNRTYESYKKSAIIASRCCAFTVIEFIILFIIVFCFSLGSLMRVEHYLDQYPGCYPELESKPYGFWTMELSGHHLNTFIFDFIENFVIWIDAGMVTTFVIELVVMLNFDILSYWRHVHDRIKYTLQKCQDFWITKQSDSDRFLFGHRQSILSLGYSDVEWNSSQSSYDWTILPKLSTPWASKHARGVPSELEDLVFETLAEIFDFFHQLAETDRFVSDAVRMCIITWLSSFTLCYYYPIGTGTEQSYSGILLQIFGMVLIGSLMIVLAELHRCTSKTYVLICSLMAYDQSKHKKCFLRVLEFYSSKGKSSFTLYQNYRLTTTTFLSMVGWTISCYIIVESLFRN